MLHFSQAQINEARLTLKDSLGRWPKLVDVFWSLQRGRKKSRTPTADDCPMKSATTHKPTEPSMSMEQFAMLCMKWIGLQHDANYCSLTEDEAKRLKAEIVEVEGQLRAAPWRVVKGEIVRA